MGGFTVTVRIYTTLYGKNNNNNTDVSGNSTSNNTTNNRTSHQTVTIGSIVPNIVDTDILLLIIANLTIYIVVLCLTMVH